MLDGHDADELFRFLGVSAERMLTPPCQRCIRDFLTKAVNQLEPQWEPPQMRQMEIHETDGRTHIEVLDYLWHHIPDACETDWRRLSKLISKFEKWFVSFEYPDAPAFLVRCGKAKWFDIRSDVYFVEARSLSVCAAITHEPYGPYSWEVSLNDEMLALRNQILATCEEKEDRR